MNEKMQKKTGAYVTVLKKKCVGEAKERMAAGFPPLHINFFRKGRERMPLAAVCLEAVGRHFLCMRVRNIMQIFIARRRENFEKSSHNYHIFPF